MQAHNLFVSQKKNHTLVIPEEMLQQVVTEAESLGYKRDSVTTAMALTLVKQNEVELPDNQVDIVLANHDLSLWAKPLVSFYLSEEHDQVIQEYVRYHEDALQRRPAKPPCVTSLMVNQRPP